jgi:PilZ domain
MSHEDQRQEYRLETQLAVFLELGDEQDASNPNHEPSIVISRSLDISANGLRIITDRALTPGSILRSCIQTHDLNTRFMLITEVKWLQTWHNPGEFLVGLALFESEDSSIQEWKEFIAQQCQAEE